MAEAVEVGESCVGYREGLECGLLGIARVADPTSQGVKGKSSEVGGELSGHNATLKPEHRPSYPILVFDQHSARASRESDAIKVEH